MKYHTAPHNRRDKIEPEIVKALAEIGVEWNECGPLDGWVVTRFAPMLQDGRKWAHSGIWLHAPRLVPVELKDPSRRDHADKFTKQQRLFMAYCDRNNLPYFIWHTVQECLVDMTGKYT